MFAASYLIGVLALSAVQCAVRRLRGSERRGRLTQISQLPIEQELLSQAVPTLIMKIDKSMKQLIPSLFCLCLFYGAVAQAPRLIVRVDDMGCSHATNLGIMRSFELGIATSVEVMVPTAWFPEAVTLLKAYPEIDAGIHLTLTSEWSGLKWGPLTRAPGLSDDWGYFYPVIWPNARFGEGRALLESDWTPAEVEAELRAQIELAKREIPQLSHVSGHMGCTGMTEEVQAMVRRLCDEYGLAIFPEDHDVERMPGLGGKELSPAEKTANFIAALHGLEEGKTYLFVEHPALDTPEQQAIGHPGYDLVAYDRMGVLAVLTDPDVKQTIEVLGIELISYADLR